MTVQENWNVGFGNTCKLWQDVSRGAVSDNSR